MKQCNRVTAHLAWAGLLFSTFPVPALCQRAPVQSTSASSTADAQAALPDSPGAVRSATDRDRDREEIAAALPQQAPQNSSSQPQSQPAAPPPPQQNPKTPPQPPVGTAVAESPSTSGMAASEPAGVAIAPAKQRRARTLIIKVGAVVAAGAAVGAIAALTLGTPSKPPGAH